MKNDQDVKVVTRKFFAAYDAHDVEGMLALCADGAQGRYLPYGKNSVMPIRGGLEKIWRGFPQAVPDFGVEIVEMIEAQRLQPHEAAGQCDRRQPLRVAYCAQLRCCLKKVEVRPLARSAQALS